MSLKTDLELHDGFSSVLNNIMGAVNATVSAFTNFQNVAENVIDTRSMDVAMDAANQTAAAIQAINDSLSRAGSMGGLDITPPIVPGPVEVEVTPVVTKQPHIDTPDDITIDMSVDGVSESQQQIEDISNRLNSVTQMQNAIRDVAKSVYVLPDDTAQSITVINREISQMQAALNFLKENPLNLDSSIAELQIKSISDSLDGLIAKQRQIDDYMGNIPSSAVNVDINPIVPDPLVDTPAPVTVPVVWNFDNLPVFTNTGVERFQQEVASANSLMETLNTTQERINARAASINIFPANAAADLNTMQSRIQAIQNCITQIANNPINMGTDTANNELEQLRAQLAQAIEAQNALNEAVDNLDVSAANEAYIRLSQTVGNTERYIRDNVDAQGRFNQEIQEGNDNANQLMNTIKGAVAAYASVQTVTKALDLSDQLTSTTARLNLMNDGLQTTEELQNMIFASAERSRGAYQATADAVSKLGLMAGDAFSSNEEIVAFMEQLNKQFTIAGTEAAGIDAAMLQLTQAMGSGVLRGEEFNSILEQAPNVIQSIADYMGVPKGQLKDLAAEGQITADIVKGALFAAADETNAQFEAMPKTFAQIGQSFQNAALMSFQPVLNYMNEIANNESFQNMVNGMIEGMSTVANITLWAFQSIVDFGGMIADNWSWISPIIYGVIAALAAYGAYLAITKGIEMISAAAKGAMAVAEGIHAAAIWATTGATWADVTAQQALNGAMYACPITWIVIGIIALIAIIYAAVGAVNKFAGTSISATGIIMGVFATLGAFIWDLVLGAVELVFGAIQSLINPFINIANFIGNVFTNPVSSIIYLFQGMADTVLGILQKIASALDFVFGSNMADTVQGWQDSIKAKADDLVAEYAPNENYQEIMSTLDFSVSDLGLERISYSDAWKAGYELGEDIDETVSNFSLNDLLGGSNFEMPTDGSGFDYTQYGAGPGANLAGDVSDIASNTGDIADTLDVTDEELKYLRDIAEQETVNRFTTAEIHVDMSGMQNNISNDMDLDGIIDGMIDGVGEAVEIAAEGVHT